MLEPPYDRVTVFFKDDRDPLVAREVTEFAQSRFPTSGEKALQIIDRPFVPTSGGNPSGREASPSNHGSSSGDSASRSEKDGGSKEKGHGEGSASPHDNVLQARIPGLLDVELILVRPGAIDHIRLERGGETCAAQPEEVL